MRAARYFDLDRVPWAKSPFDGDSDKWGDEQDRSDYFADAAHYWAGRAARAEQLARKRRGFDRFTREVAALTKDGEPLGDEPEWVMENDDAYDTLHGLISGARALVGKLDRRGKP